MPHHSAKSLRERIRDFLSADSYRPLKQHELARALGVSSGERAIFRRVLYQMEQEGDVACLRKNRFALADSGRQVRGVLRVNPQGFGFVSPDLPDAPDIFIPEASMATGLDGDRVIVALDVSGARRPARRVRLMSAPRVAGRVVRILERRRTTLVGLLRRTPYYWYVIPDDLRIPHTVRLRDKPESRPSPEEYWKVVVQLDEWNDAAKPLTGKVIESLGPASAPGMDMLSVLRDHQIETEFPAPAMDESRRHAAAVTDAARSARRDLRDVTTITIDPEDAKDFDDAVSASRTPEGGWILGVHIADVAHYVPKGSPIDEEAGQRGNSVYLVDRVVPMLPPYLTTEVCSLQPASDRLTHSVEMEFSHDGRLVRRETFRSVIRSSCRLNYDQVQEHFTGAGTAVLPAPVRSLLDDMRPLARLLRARRMSAGAIDLSIPEIRCVLDAEGHVTAIRKRVSNEAYQLIEEFMLAANCVVAGLLAAKEVPALYRIHEEPADDQWARMALDLEALNVRAEIGSRASLNAVAASASGTPLEYSVHLAILRNLKRAVYSPSLEAHFGLAVARYTHFTSPIRRYPDLVVHRMLCALESGRPPPYSHEEAARIAEHCSRTERNADEAEEESVTIKRIEYLAARLREGHAGPFPALLVSLVPKGMIFELADSLQRGLVPFSSLRDDIYDVDENRHRAVGRRRRKVWRIGQTTDVFIARVDRVRKQVDLYLPEEERTESRRAKSTTPKGQSHRIR